jgi:glutaredoxin
MNKKVLIPTILFAVVLIFSVVVLVKNKGGNNLKPENPPNKQSEIILFYGDDCPHCAIVEEYIKDNKVKEKISFEEKEVYYNKENSDELVEKAKICGIPENYIGVPFLWDGEKCLVGDQEIIEFFNQKINEK